MMMYNSIITSDGLPLWNWQRLQRMASQSKGKFEAAPATSATYLKMLFRIEDGVPPLKISTTEVLCTSSYRLWDIRRL